MIDGKHLIVCGLMAMGVFAEIRNGFERLCKYNIFVFQIWVKKNTAVIRCLEMYVSI